MATKFISSSVDNFLKQVFNFDADTSWFAKLITLLVVVPLYLFGLYCLLSSFGLFGKEANFIAQHAHYAATQRPLAHLWGFIFLAVSVFIIWAHFTNRFIKFELSPVAIGVFMLLVIIITICINCNFRFDMNHIIVT